MRDRDIRSLLMDGLRLTYANDPETRIVQEFGLCRGSVRIDVAVVNGMLLGYEIKSDADTLERLPIQQEVYSRIFDRVTIVVGSQHCFKIKSVVPSWWGIWKATETPNGSTALVTLRRPKDNPTADSFALAQCLWRDEAIALLRTKDMLDGLERARRSILWQEISNAIPHDELKAYVCFCLKSRRDWRTV